MRPLVVALVVGALTSAWGAPSAVRADGRDEEERHDHDGRPFRPPVRPARDVDYLRGSPALVTLGQALYFDKILTAMSRAPPAILR